MAGGRAKTAGRGRVGTKNQAYQTSAEIHRIQPLNGGRHARVFDPTNGKSRHLATGGDEIISVFLGFGPDWCERIAGELGELDTRFPGAGWGDLRERVIAAAAAAGAEDGETVEA